MNFNIFSFLESGHKNIKKILDLSGSYVMYASHKVGYYILNILIEYHGVSYFLFVFNFEQSTF